MTELPTDNLRYAMANALWEEAKGKLRAMLELEGARIISPNEERPTRFDCLKRIVDEFIERIDEDDIYGS